MKNFYVLFLFTSLFASAWGQDTIVKKDSTANNYRTPGAGMDIVVRGPKIDNRPLYIVDGEVVGRECKIDPNEIESVEIRNPNSWDTRDKGAIIITTKRGSYILRPEAIPKYLYGSETDFTKKIVKQLELQATQHKVKDQIIVICTINEKGEIHVIKTNIEKDYIFNQYLISALENTVQWRPARQNGNDVESLNMFVFDFNEE